MCCTPVLLYAKTLKETENEETRLFCHVFVFGSISIGGDPGPLGPLLATPMIVTSILFVILRFWVLFGCLPLGVYQSDTNGSSLYDHAKYVILLVKVKIVLNSSRDLKL